MENPTPEPAPTVALEAPPIVVPAPAPVALESVTPEPSPWPLLLRVLFRVAFIYEILFSLPFPVGRFAGMSGILVRTRPVMAVVLWFSDAWDRIVAWAGPALFEVHVDVSNHNFLSGDRLYDWVRLGCIALAALVGAAVWSAVDYRRLHYRRLYDGLRVYGRADGSVLTIGSCSRPIWRMSTFSMRRLTA